MDVDLIDDDLKMGVVTQKTLSSTELLKVAFQMLADIKNYEQVQHGLLLPAVFRTKLTPNCTSIKLVDCYNREYTVCVSRAPDHQCFICLAQWGRFASEVITEDTRRICLRLVEVNKFLVICFDEEGLEFIEDNEEQLIVNRFLAEATYETFTKQLAPPGFLSKFDVPITRERSRPGPPKGIPDLQARIIGSRQHGEVNIIYQWSEEIEEWEACGFQGPKWTNICFENNVEVGYTVMFSRYKNLEFSLDVFNSANVGLGLADEETDDEFVEITDEDGCEVLGDPDARDFTHECRVKHHKHKLNRPHFFCKLKHACFTHSRLNVEKEMVQEFRLNKYQTALIHYGKVSFSAVMEVKVDKRVVGE